MSIRSSLTLALALCGACNSGPQGPAQDPLDLADLPNGHLTDKLHDDGLTYGAIIDSIEEREAFDLAVERDAISLSWPIAGEQTVLLNRFGTPLLGLEDAYFHTALDIVRGDPGGDDGVYAPFSGMALPFDWWGRRGYTRVHYTSVLVVWDPVSHAVAFLNHSVPDQKLRDTGRKFVQVEAGERIGTLAADILHVAESERERFRHIHLALLDGSTRTALNPASFSDYRDETAPETVSAYLLDDAGIRHDRLQAGPVDLVLETFDRDRDSERNFEIAGLSFEVRIDGEVVHRVSACELDRFYESFATDTTEPATALLDFGHAAHQIDQSDWPGRDLDDRNRTFRYALTQLSPVEQGGCALIREDDQGQLEILPGAGVLEVEGTLWDQAGNRRAFQSTIVP